MSRLTDFVQQVSDLISATSLPISVTPEIRYPAVFDLPEFSEARLYLTPLKEVVTKATRRSNRHELFVRVLLSEITTDASRIQLLFETLETIQTALSYQAANGNTTLECEMRNFMEPEFEADENRFVGNLILRAIMEVEVNG